MTEPAPGRLSTTKDWPGASCKRCAMKPAQLSAGQPAANGTMILSDLQG